jgi:hypothetical protein
MLNVCSSRRTFIGLCRNSSRTRRNNRHLLKSTQVVLTSSDIPGLAPQ